MPPAVKKHNAPQTLFRWIEREARRRRIQIVLHKKRVRWNGNFLYLPAYVKAPGAWEFVEALQNLEDSWNNAEPRHKTRLALEPAERD